MSVDNRPAPAGRAARLTGYASGALGRPVAQASHPWVLAGVAAAVAAVFLWLVLAPLGRATNDADSAASVLYFERITSGHGLESFLPTTPKPFLTALYGALWWLTHDWRSLTLITLAAAAASAGMAARLADRLAGPAAAVLAVVGLLAWPDYQVQVAGANSFVWGLALWLLAGVLITADRPRPWAVGVVLLLAVLTRTETIWLLLAAGLAALYLTVRAHRSGDWTRALGAWPPVLGALALPLACLHDLVLTGKPLYWLNVPAGYTALVFPDIKSTPLSLVRAEATHYLALLPLVLLAAVGVAHLVATRRRFVSLALACLAGGVLLTLVYLAWRAVYVSPRYYAEADAPLLLAAAVGGAVLLSLSLDLVVARRPALPTSEAAPSARPRAGRVAVTAGAALVLALGVVLAAVPQGDVRTQLSRSGDASAALELIEPRLVPILSGAGGDTMAVAGVGYPVADPRSARIFVPRAFLARISVDIGVPATALGDSYLAFRDRDYSVLSPGQWVLHIASADDPGPAYGTFEITDATALARPNAAPLRLVPVFVDVSAGIWLIRVEAA